MALVVTSGSLHYYYDGFIWKVRERTTREFLNIAPAHAKEKSPNQDPRLARQAADWAHLYLMSELPRDVVDSLFMIPLESERELQNLLMGSEECILLGGAQHAWGQVEG